MVRLLLRSSLLLLAAVAVASLSAVARAGELCGDASAPPVGDATTTLPLRRPLIIGHRGAAGYLPDHTLEGYTLAIATGVDFIEPDLVATKDGILVARHEPNIIATTDVASRPEFASRKKTVAVDGVAEEGFFVSDFTLAEIKTLRAVQPLPERDQSFNGLYEIPTFDEILALAQAKGVGVYPETKHPTYHRALGLPLEDRIVAALDRVGWNHAQAPVVLQSFEPSSLQELRRKTNVQISQLVNGGYINPKTGDQVGVLQPYDWTVDGRSGTYLDMLSAAGLREIAAYADIVAPYKRYLVTNLGAKFDAVTGAMVDATGDGLITDADYVVKENPQVFADIHAAGLQIHAWTFRDEAYRLAVDYAGDPVREYDQFFRLGVDAVFSDNCKTAVPARDAFVAKQSQ